MTQVVPLNPTAHGKLRVKGQADVQASAGQQILPLVVHEFTQAGNDTPVVFVKDATNEQFQPVQLLGLAQGENLLVDGQRWLGGYIPFILRGAPFRLMKTSPDAEQVTVGIDEDSPLVSEEEGEALFNEDGSPSDYLQQRRDDLQRYVQQGQLTEAFVKRLMELDLLVPQELNLELAGQKSNITGIYLVSEQKLRELDDATTLDLNRRGFLVAIHAHLMSLGQTRRLARLKLDAAGAAGARVRGA